MTLQTMIDTMQMYTFTFDEDGRYMTPARLVGLLNSAQIRLFDTMKPGILTPFDTKDESVELDSDGAFDITALESGVYRNGAGILQVKLHGTDYKFCNRITLDQYRKEINAGGDTPFNTTRPIYYVFGNNAYVMPTGYNVDVWYRAAPTAMSLDDGDADGDEFLLATDQPNTGWTTDGDWTDGWTHTVGNVVTLLQTKPAVVATTYQIVYTVTGRTAGTFTIAFGGYSSPGLSATGTFNTTATSVGNLVITPTADFDGKIVISIKPFVDVSSELDDVYHEILIGLALEDYVDKDSSIMRLYNRTLARIAEINDSAPLPDDMKYGTTRYKTNIPYGLGYLSR